MSWENAPLGVITGQSPVQKKNWIGEQGGWQLLSSDTVQDDEVSLELECSRKLSSGDIDRQFHMNKRNEINLCSPAQLTDSLIFNARPVGITDDGLNTGLEYGMSRGEGDLAMFEFF